MSSTLPSFRDAEQFKQPATDELRIGPLPLLHASRARRRAVMVGSGNDARKLAEYLNQHPLAGLNVRGFLDSGRPGDRVLGTVDELRRIALSEFVDEVIITEPYDRELVQRVVRQASELKMGVRVIPNLFGLDPRVVAVERLGDLPMLKLRERKSPSFGFFLKGIFDLLFSAAALLLLAPVLAVIALLIAVSSRGPVFYRAIRLGQRGRKFRCYKFRTMVEGADEQRSQLRRRNERRGPLFKMTDDPRVTRVGRWLRRYSLDELPQLWNVLRGDMSLVGPRPHPLDDCAFYELEHLRRLEVKPGMTGLWQVTARNDPSFQRNMALDLEYIAGWNLWLDLRILCKTAAAVWQGSGM
jgi:exopolysaccharide biosynthesis polyprenyl glycosylphosphotransferase